MTLDSLIPLAEAFAKAGLRSTKGYAEIGAGRLIVTRNGRRNYVRASDLQAYIDRLPRSSGEPVTGNKAA